MSDREKVMLAAIKGETDLRMQAERDIDSWRSLCLGLLDITHAIIEQLSVELHVEFIDEEPDDAAD